MQLGQSVAFEEKSGILYVHIYLPAMVLHRTAGFLSPWFLLPLDPRQGQREGGQDGLQGVMVLRWEDHTRPLKKGTFLHLLDTDLLEVKGL